ncbi:MAG: cell envelope integrity protein TolA [Candidatus Acidiferrum sp.]
MKAIGMMNAAALFVLLGIAAPAIAGQDKPEAKAKPAQHEQQAKPQKQQEAKAPKQERQAKPEKQQQARAPKQEQQAKPEKQQQQARASKQQQQAKAERQQQQARSTKQEHVQQSKGQQHGQAQGQWAHNGQKDSRGHVYNASRFGRDHHARFEQNGGRVYEGRREYSYGGYWFYAGVYPPWFYQQQVYFMMGADGLWYAVAYDNPSLMFQVSIG